MQLQKSDWLIVKTVSNEIHAGQFEKYELIYSVPLLLLIQDTGSKIYVNLNNVESISVQKSITSEKG